MAVILATGMFEANVVSGPPAGCKRMLRVSFGGRFPSYVQVMVSGDPNCQMRVLGSWGVTAMIRYAAMAVAGAPGAAASAMAGERTTSRPVGVASFTERMTDVPAATPTGAGNW